METVNAILILREWYVMSPKLLSSFGDITVVSAYFCAYSIKEMLISV